jgi:hypothetical protein
MVITPLDRTDEIGAFLSLLDCVLPTALERELKPGNKLLWCSYCVSAEQRLAA